MDADERFLDLFEKLVYLKDNIASDYIDINKSFLIRFVVNATFKVLQFTKCVVTSPDIEEVVQCCRRITETVFNIGDVLYADVDEFIIKPRVENFIKGYIKHTYPFLNLKTDFPEEKLSVKIIDNKRYMLYNKDGVIVRKRDIQLSPKS